MRLSSEYVNVMRYDLFNTFNFLCRKMNNSDLNASMASGLVEAHTCTKSEYMVALWVN